MSSHTEYDLELLTFPCSYPIKAFAATEHQVEVLLAALLKAHVPHDISADDIVLRQSSGGRYSSVTITFEATSKDQLDAIYADIRADKRFLMSL